MRVLLYLKPGRGGAERAHQARGRQLGELNCGTTSQEALISTPSLRAKHGQNVSPPPAPLPVPTLNARVCRMAKTLDVVQYVSTPVETGMVNRVASSAIPRMPAFILVEVLATADCSPPSSAIAIIMTPVMIGKAMYGSAAPRSCAARKDTARTKQKLLGANEVSTHNYRFEKRRNQSSK